jgi:predicted SPOUT superfamily RNA methylase MTH1
MSYVFRSRVFKDKRTGKLATQIPILDMCNWEEVKNPTIKQYREATRAKLKKVM